MMSANFANRTLYTGDNLDVMRGIDSETVDLIYLDPPFNSKRTYHAPIGSDATGASFDDIWSMDDVKDEWIEDLQIAHKQLWFAVEGGAVHSEAMKAYLAFMAIRLLEMERILKPTGTVLLHCDTTASHYLKQVMDVVFGANRFRNEIIWHYGKMSNAKKNFPNNHDVIFRYTKGDDFTFNLIRGEESEYKVRFERYLTDNQVLYGSVKTSQDKLVLRRVQKVKKSLGRDLVDDDVLFDFDEEFKQQSDVIYVSIIKGNAKERTGYPTQKPIDLLKRLIQATSDEGDMVLDPFCGCATTCVAAELLGRRWVGIDIEEEAANLVKKRLADAADDGALLKEGGDNGLPEVTHLYDPPKRTDPEAPRRSPHIKEKLHKEQDGRCAGLCLNGRVGRLLDMDLFEVDHIMPRSKGGADIDENLQLLCPTCNGRKGNRPMSYLLELNLVEGREAAAAADSSE